MVQKHPSSALPEAKTIPGGVYRIGDETDPISSPAHTVTLASFNMAETAITNGQFKSFVDAGGYRTPSYWSNMGWRWQKNKQVNQPAFWDQTPFNHPLQPVVGICWYEAAAYCQWLCDLTGDPWRLPTEAEWEVAAETENPIPATQINTTYTNIRRTWGVWGRGQRSYWGIADMLGNIWEWTSSRWGRNWQTLEYLYPYTADDGREDASGSHARVMRGGSWFDPPELATASTRGRFLPGSRASNIGFRVVC